MVKVLFVCTGNICRSPTAEGVFRKLVEDAGLSDAIWIASAGTHGYHVGQPPDRRTMQAALRRAVDLSAQRARQLRKSDFETFDLILAMDRGHYERLVDLAPPGTEARVHMFMKYAPQLDREEVPDPYYGGSEGFEDVLDMVEAAAAGLLDAVRKEHLRA